MEPTDIEKRVRYLEDSIERLSAALQAIGNKASAAYQSSGMPSGDGGGQQGVFIGYITTDLPAGSGNSVGVGTVKRVGLVGTTMTYVGGPDITNAFNVTGAAVTAPRYVAYARCEGKYLVFLGDCATATRTAPATAPLADPGLFAAT